MNGPEARPDHSYRDPATDDAPNWRRRGVSGVVALLLAVGAWIAFAPRDSDPASNRQSSGTGPKVTAKTGVSARR